MFPEGIAQGFLFNTGQSGLDGRAMAAKQRADIGRGFGTARDRETVVEFRAIGCDQRDRHRIEQRADVLLYLCVDLAELLDHAVVLALDLRGFSDAGFEIAELCFKRGPLGLRTRAMNYVWS